MAFPTGAAGTNPFSIHADRTPLTLDDSTRALYNRAISDPSSLTDQERRLITYRPPPEEEDALCRNACGLSMDELVTKAINSDDSNSNSNNNNNNAGPTFDLSLSGKEVSLLISGVVPGQSGRIITQAARLSPEDRHLKAQAMEVARPDDLRAAREVAARVLKQLTVVELAAAEALSDDDVRNIRFAMKVPWQDHVLQSSSASAGGSGSGGQGPGEAEGRFGLVVFYQEEGEGGREANSRLMEYKSQIRTAVHHGLHYSASLIKDETRKRFTLHWVAAPGGNNNNNNLDPGALRSRFSTMLSNDEIPIGFRRDAFLYVDEEALRSREAARPFLWLAEPEPEPEAEPATGAHPEALQPLKVGIKNIAPTLFARLVQRDLQGEARRKPYRHTSELSRLHAATDANRERDGIWPPPSRYQ